MKILVDQNISHRIVAHISFLFEQVVHVKTSGWIDWNDYDIFMAARQQQYDAVMTLDEDFNKLLIEHSCPPKIIWLKTGNCSTAKLVEVVVLHQSLIKDFLEESEFDCLEIYGQLTFFLSNSRLAQFFQPILPDYFSRLRGHLSNKTQKFWV